MKGGKLPNIIKRLLPLIEMLALFAIAALIGSCCSDCPTGPAEPQPYKGWLYALDYWNDWLYQIDLETDSVVDSLQHEEYMYMTGAFDVSKDGKYLAVSFTRTNPLTRTMRIFDAQNLQLITELEGGGYPAFTDDGQKLIVCDEDLKIFQVPGFSLMYEDEIGRSAQPIIVEHDVLILQMLNWASSDSQYIAKYNYDSHEIDTFVISDDLGSWFSFHQFDISGDGRYLYYGGYADDVPSSLNCYDLQTREFVFRIPVYTVHGAVELNPSETKLYFTDPGFPTSYQSPGTVFIYDPYSGQYLGGISLFGYTKDEDVYYPLYANGVAFTPDGNWAYVGTGDPFRIDGGIVVIDANKQIVKKLIWPELGHFIDEMRIGPKT
jgi:DNA-binding beta-propeller fold protein YncE